MLIGLDLVGHSNIFYMHFNDKKDNRNFVVGNWPAAFTHITLHFRLKYTSSWPQFVKIFLNQVFIEFQPSHNQCM